MAIITTDDKHYHAIADAIREKAGTDKPYTPDEMPLGVAHAYGVGTADGYNVGMEDGTVQGKYVANQWWIDLIKDKTDLNYFFKGGQFETLPEGLDFSHVTTMSQTFMGCSKIKQLPHINTTKCTNLPYVLSGVGSYSGTIMEEVSIDVRSAKETEQMASSINARKLKLVGNLSTATSVANIVAFSSIQEIRAYEDESMAVEIPIDLSNNTRNSAFSNASAIKYFRVAPGSIKVTQNIAKANLLEDGTIQSIIDGLADLTGAAAQTLTLHAEVGANLTQAQKDAVSAKNWTLVY